MKSVRIWSFFGLHFPTFGLNTERHVSRSDVHICFSVYQVVSGLATIINEQSITFPLDRRNNQLLDFQEFNVRPELTLAKLIQKKHQEVRCFLDL